MIELTFRVETLESGHRVKVRQDGRRGACVADEAILWDAYQEQLAEADRLREKLEAAAERIAGQSEAMSHKAEGRKR